MNTQDFTILLLDDEPSVLFALKLLLQALNFKVKDFSDPNTALDHIANTNDVGMFLCDLRMPEKNGLEVLSAARCSAPKIPFVLMSAHANSSEVEDAKKLGAYSFLAKPFSPEELKNLVQQILSER